MATVSTLATVVTVATAVTVAKGVTVAEGGKGVVRLVGEVDNLRVTRELTFNSENYLISEKVSLATLGADTRSVRVRYPIKHGDKDGQCANRGKRPLTL